ncbi:MAG TPA: peptidylprolyl isomerase [Bryobacteraceae bacterium]|jgi:peptidyl-prolyl cis-trans isomerase A (cyclophilin A)|nr:peptidylprolyl isomerase [Bryobacteraceae bacterium]
MKQLLTIMFVCGATFAQTKATTAAKKAPAPTRSLLDPSTLKATAPATYKAKFTTTQGDFILQVTRAWAPIGADRFYNLVRGKFFDGSPFFRVIPGFMVQFGLNTNPKVSSVWMTQDLQDEPVKQSNKRGFISYAKAGPNTRTTQVFINYGDNSRLDPQGFSPFGEVIEGMDVVEKFNSEYGDNGSSQSGIQQMGKAWLDKNMPKVDYIKTAVIVPAVPPPAAATKSTTAKAPATKATTTTKQ